MTSGNRYLGASLSTDLVRIAEKKAGKLISDRFFSPDDFKDLQHELLIAIWQAMRAYELAQKPIINKQAFAQDVVNKRAINLIKKAQTQKQGKDVSIRSLHDSIGDNEDYLLIDTITENSTFCEHKKVSFVEQMEFDLDIKLMVDKLPDDLKELYRLTQTMNITEIAKVTRKSRTTIHKKFEILKSRISKILADRS